MAKAELGLKRVCLGCGARFYDLNKVPAFCPHCGKEFDPLASSHSSRSRQSEVAKTQSKKSKAEKSEQSGVTSPKDIELEDDDEVLAEDMEDEDELIGPSDKDQ